MAATVVEREGAVRVWAAEEGAAMGSAAEEEVEDLVA